MVPKDPVLKVRRSVGQIEEGDGQYVLANFVDLSLRLIVLNRSDAGIEVNARLQSTWAWRIDIFIDEIGTILKDCDNSSLA